MATLKQKIVNGLGKIPKPKNAGKKLTVPSLPKRKTDGVLKK